MYFSIQSWRESQQRRTTKTLFVAKDRWFLALTLIRAAGHNWNWKLLCRLIHHSFYLSRATLNELAKNILISFRYPHHPSTATDVRVFTEAKSGSQQSFVWASVSFSPSTARKLNLINHGVCSDANWLSKTNSERGTSSLGWQTTFLFHKDEWQMWEFSRGRPKQQILLEKESRCHQFISYNSNYVYGVSWVSQGAKELWR